MKNITLALLLLFISGFKPLNAGVQFPSSLTELEETGISQATSVFINIINTKTEEEVGITVPFDPQKSGLQEMLSNHFGDAKEVYQKCFGLFVPGIKYTVQIRTDWTTTVPHEFFRTRELSVSLQLRELSFLYTGKLPPQVTDISAYVGMGPKTYVYYRILPAPGLKRVVIERWYVDSTHRSLQVDNNNGSTPPGCWLQTDIPEGYLCLETWWFQPKYEITLYFENNGWERYNLGTGKLVASSKPPLSLSIGFEGGSVVVTLSGEGAGTAKIEESPDLTNWTSENSLRSPPLLMQEDGSLRKHRVAEGAPQRFYRIREPSQDSGSQKQN